jgi:hypothetical protein
MKSFLLFLLLFPALVLATDPVEQHSEWDQQYSTLIREATTGPQFMTDLVDHLPASGKVPTPQKFLGYIAGAPDHLTYAEDVHRYMRALEAASPRVKVFSIGKSEEGREMIAVAIADEQTIGNLNHYQEITAKLADPRGLADAEAAKLITEGKPIYYITGAMHSPETGSPEMLMELAYRLAVEETPFVQSIRSNIVTLITPVLDVDGRDRMVDTVRWQQANPGSSLPPLIYWGHYVAHDNNRDMMGLALNLSRNVLDLFFQWHPQVVHDLHESIPFLYISTGTGPYNAWLDPVAIDEWERMAYNEVQALTEKGLPGVWTHGFYDGWAPNYMFWAAHGHNAIGRFYETFGNGVPATQDRVVRDASQRQWFRPNPPLPQVKWSLRNNVNYQQSGILLALNYMAANREHFLQTFWTLGKRAVAKATTEGPAAYVFPGDQKRTGQLRDLLNLLRRQGIEVQQTDQACSLKLNWPPKKEEEKGDGVKGEGKKGEGEKKEDDTATFPAGSYVIRMDQPYSRLADTLLDTQYVRSDEKVYDDTGWTLSYLKNVECKRIVNMDVLKTPMHPWAGASAGSRPAIHDGRVIAIANSADTDLVRLMYSVPGIKAAASEEEYKDKKKTWPAGTVFIHVEGLYSKQLQDALGSLSLSYEPMDAVPGVKSHPLAQPRIAILHTWLDTQQEGWYRLAFESMKVPYEYISTQAVAHSTDLRAQYDVIVFPPTDADPESIVNGMPAGSPIPWKKTDLTPNLAVDQTDDIRPGLGLSGVQNLHKFVEDGGLLITAQTTAQWAVQYGLARWVKVVEPQQLKANGSIMKGALTDHSSPVAYGYDDTMPVYFSGAPIFKVGVFDTDEPPKLRPSGRGSKTDPDVPQGRPFVELPDKPKPEPGEDGFQLPENYAIFLEPYIPKIEERPRVILSFAKEPDELLLSGMLDGGEEIAGKPVVIDSPLGKGHILLFANNPMWRMNTQGSYALIFNAILNYQNLNAGWPPEKIKDKK